MPFNLAKQLQSRLSAKASALAFNSVLYNWTLQWSLDWSLGSNPAENLIVIPTDCWKGDSEKGRWLISGAFSLEDMQLEIHTLNNKRHSHSTWEPEGVHDNWLKHMHSFDWLRDLRELGGDTARKQARDMTENWTGIYKRWNPLIWRSDLIGQRIANWIGFYNFFGASADENFQDNLIRSIIVQAKHLARSIGTDTHGIGTLYAAKGLIYAGICLSGRELWLEQGLNVLEKETDKQILGDGGHISRSPEQILTALRIFFDIRSALAQGGYPVPAGIEGTISNLAQALRFFRYPDRHLALFHDTQEVPIDTLDEILRRVNARGKILKALPKSGYERANIGRSLLMVDAAAPPPFPYDAEAHAAPLSFEFCYGKERIFVNCGHHPIEPDWQDVLRSTAAHNNLTLDYRNICEIRSDKHLGRKPRKISVHREDKKDAVLLELSHDGYMAVSGVTHRRKLYLGDHGHDFRGEERLNCSIGLDKSIDVTLRFHLHPRVLVSLIQDGTEALLRLPGGSGWRFFHDGGRMELENSIYLGQGSRARKTKQIVIHGKMESDQAVIKWALKREGL